MDDVQLREDGQPYGEYNTAGYLMDEWPMRVLLDAWWADDTGTGVRTGNG